MTNRRKPPVACGIGGDYPTTELPGKIIEPRIDHVAVRAAAQIEKLESQQDSMEGGDASAERAT